MGSSESKQAESRLREISLTVVDFPPVLYLQYQSCCSFKMHLCDQGSRPVCLVTLPNGGHGEMVVYADPSSEQGAPPLAVVSRGRARRINGSTVRLAPAFQGGPLIEEELRTVGSGLSLAYAFAIRLDNDGQKLPQKFEWRGSRGDEVRSLGQRARGWKLVRCGGVEGESEEEVVAVWADVCFTKSLRKAAKFQFVGSGASRGGGGLGDAWRAMAVVTFLRLWQTNSRCGAAGAASASSSSAAGTVIAAGV